MSRSPRDEAALLAYAIQLGVLDPADVIVWAEARLEADAHPHWAIVELCTMGRASVRDVVGMLQRLPGEPDWVWLRTEIVRLVARRMRAAPERGPRLLAVLWKLANQRHLPNDEVEQAIFGADRDLARAEAGGDDVAHLYAELARRLEAAVAS